MQYGCIVSGMARISHSLKTLVTLDYLFRLDKSG